MKIPIVNVGKIANFEEPDKKALADVSRQLHDAFTTSGFVYLVGHGFPDELLQKIWKASRSFFEDNSVETKKAAFPLDSANLVGYSAPNEERLAELSEDKEEVKLYEFKESLESTSVAEDSPYPDDIAPEIRPLFKEASEYLLPLTRRILQALSVALGLDKDYLSNLHSGMLQPGNKTDIRSLYYPPIKEGAKAGLIRCGDHMDFGTITFLFQDPIGGLEVKDVDEGWIRARPIEGSILVNLGEQMEILTNGRYRATRHRVVVPEEELTRRTHRQSFAFFAKADDKVILSPVMGEAPVRSKYGPVKCADLHRRLIKTTYDTKIGSGF